MALSNKGRNQGAALRLAGQSFGSNDGYVTLSVENGRLTGENAPGRR